MNSKSKSSDRYSILYPIFVISIPFIILYSCGFVYDQYEKIKETQKHEAEFRAACETITSKRNPNSEDFYRLLQLVDQRSKLATFDALKSLLAVVWTSHSRGKIQGKIEKEEVNQTIKNFFVEYNVRKIVDQQFRFVHKQIIIDSYAEPRSRLKLAIVWYRSIATIPNEFSKQRINELQVIITKRLNNPKAVWNNPSPSFPSSAGKLLQWPESERKYYFFNGVANDEKKKSIEWSPAIKFSNRLFILHGYGIAGKDSHSFSRIYYSLWASTNDMGTMGIINAGLDIDMLIQKGFVANPNLERMSNKQLKQKAAELVDVLAENFSHNLFASDLKNEFNKKLNSLP